ncbi:hypothetical protein MMC18_002787 [Xylographa bjoerkii]|nr:hypothetical protein [Xylographa bjoerkii]
MNHNNPNTQVDPEDDLPTFTSSVLARVGTYFKGRPIYRNNSAPRDPAVGNDIPWSWSPTSSTPTLVNTPPTDDTPPRVQSVQRHHSKESIKPRDPYAQFRWGYGRHLFRHASPSDSPVVIPATGSDLFQPPKLSKPAPKVAGVCRRKSQEFEVLDKEDDNDNEFFDAEEFFDTGDTGDTEFVDAGPKIKVHHAFTADEEELLADAIREDRDVENIRMDFQGMLARLDAEHRGKK